MSLSSLFANKYSRAKNKKVAYSIIIASPLIIALISFLLARDGSTWSLNPWMSFLISLASISAGTVIAALLIQKSKLHEQSINEHAKRHTYCKDVYKGSFSDIIRDGNYYASLPRFQFLLWTFVISFTFLSVYLIRILGGEYSFPTQIPTEVLELMGISVVVPTISTPLSSFKYDSTLAQKPPCKEQITPVSDMLLESGKPALFRYQMFLWTLISIGIYILVFFSQAIGAINNHPIIQNQITSCMQLDIARTSPNANSNPTLKTNLESQFHAKCASYPLPFDKNKTLKDLSLPNIDPSLVILTGLSQGGYLGGKLVTRTPVRIERLVSGINKTLTIFGSNFLERSGTVIINGDKVYMDKKGIATWADSMIEVSVDDDTIKSWRTIEVITAEATQARHEREAPYVDYTQPYDHAKNVPVDIKTILAVFSEPMKAEAITPDKFTLRTIGGNGTIKLGKVTYDTNKKNFNFDLQETLDPSTYYIATIDSSVTNEIGIPMVEDEEWSFITQSTATPTPTLSEFSMT